MGKKTDRVSRDKQSIHQSDESVIKTPEPYQCCGNFATDFSELWKEQYPSKLPIPINPHNKRGLPLSSNSHDNPPTTQPTKKGGKDDKKPQSVSQAVEPEQIPTEDKEIINIVGFKPKHFIVKPNILALKPAITVETDNIEKPDNATEISIRRWKFDLPVLEIFGTCFAAINKLTTLNFWRADLTSEVITKLADILTSFENIKYLTIENNSEVENENYHEFIKAGSNLTKLHLRCCNITPMGSKLIADTLGSLNNSNTNSKLLVLDLNGNKLGDHGALELALALKINRTLLSLSVSNCDIGDWGCMELAKSISQFMLTDKEIFARREMLSERNLAETTKSLSSYSRASLSSENSPPLSRRGDSKDRPTSVRSSNKDDKNKKETKGTAKGKKDAKDEKQDKSSKGKKDEKSSSKKASALIDSSKTGIKTKGRSARLSKAVNQMETMSDSTENLENIHPLLNKVEAIEPGKLMISGNFMLLMLNLSRNRITEAALETLDKALTFQTNQMSTSKVNGTGLMKLILQGNEFELTNEKVVKINNLLTNRDHKSKTPTIEE